MKHIDLFSGIGGFALAAREVWGDEYENVCFCEINKYAQAVLRKQFGKDVVIYGDIRGLTADAHGSGCGASESKADKNRAKVSEERKLSLAEHSGCRIDLLTGGFPCQPFSQAGKRKGTSDERHLWPEMLRVIREFRPTWVVAENVRGLLTIDGGLVFETCCSDLEREGYDVQPFVIPACAVNAPHRRDRVWIVGRRIDGDSESYGNPSEREISSKGKRNQESADTLGSDRRNQQKEQIVAHSQSRKSGVASEREGRESIGGGDTEGGIRSSSHHQLRLQEPRPELEAGRDRPDHQDAPNAGCEHGARTTKQGEHEVTDRSQDAPELERSAQCNPSGAFGGTKSPRLQGGVVGSRKVQHGGASAGSVSGHSWEQNWLEVATRFCGVDDGLPGEMDGTTLTKAGHRVERLKALGNAIVPQVAAEIFNGIRIAIKAERELQEALL